MHRFLLASLFLGTLAPGAFGGEILDQIETIITTYEDTVRANTMKMIEAKTEEEKATYRASVPSVAPYAPQVLDLVKAHPDDPDVIRGVSWLVIQAPSTPEGQEALTLLGETYATSPGIAEAVKRLEYQPLELASPILTRVRDTNPHAEEQAAATFALGMIHFRRAGQFPDSSEKATAFFRDIVSRYPDVKIQGFPLADQASQMIFEMTHLAEGGEAPEIEGIDAMGQAFKLSDYRGKHVVLCFWGGWCHACHGILPLLNQFHAQSEGKPLVVLGVNTDAGDEGPAALQQYEVKFRNWMDQTTGGPITTLYNLRNFPTLYLIDDQGIILKRNPSLTDITTCLDQLTSDQ